MPYKAYPNCKLPENKNIRIWRYIDFTKFVSMLEDSSLYFTRITEFLDTFEGYLSIPSIEYYSFNTDGLDNEDARHLEQLKTHALASTREGRKLLFVSAWHMNEDESEAMWKIYAKDNKGIAIQSTIAKFIDSFACSEEDILLSEVNYIDYKAERIPNADLLYLALHKRKSFKHECELRAIVIDTDDVNGKLIKVDLNVLIDQISIAPKAPPWQRELLRKVLIRYNLNKEVFPSALDDRPPY